MTGACSYVPLSRGFRSHLAKLTGNAVKLYVYLLTSASFAGPTKGQVAASFRDLASELWMHRQTIYKAAVELRPYYVTWKAAKNQHGVTIFTIQKYKSVGDFAVSRRTTSEVTASEQHVDSEVTASSVTDTEQMDFAPPNKPKKPNKPEKPAEAWPILGIPPTFSKEFNEFWEGCYENRNGYTLSKVMRDCVEAWQASGGKVPGPFFAAKAEITNAERASRDKTSTGHICRIPTAEDCRPKDRR